MVQRLHWFKINDLHLFSGGTSVVQVVLLFKINGLAFQDTHRFARSGIEIS